MIQRIESVVRRKVEQQKHERKAVTVLDIYRRQMAGAVACLAAFVMVIIGAWPYVSAYFSSGRTDRFAALGGRIVGVRAPSWAMPLIVGGVLIGFIGLLLDGSEKMLTPEQQGDLRAKWIEHSERLWTGIIRVYSWAGIAALVVILAAVLKWAWHYLLH